MDPIAERVGFACVCGAVVTELDDVQITLVPQSKCIMCKCVGDLHETPSLWTRALAMFWTIGLNRGGLALCADHATETLTTHDDVLAVQRRKEGNNEMAHRTVYECDKCGSELPKEPTVTIAITVRGSSLATNRNAYFIYCDTCLDLGIKPTLGTNAALFLTRRNWSDEHIDNDRRERS